MTRGGNWPPADDDLVTNYLNTFSRFIKSVWLSKTELKHPVICPTSISANSDIHRTLLL
jgi:hypothetical protein